MGVSFEAFCIGEFLYIGSWGWRLDFVCNFGAILSAVLVRFCLRFFGVVLIVSMGLIWPDPSLSDYPACPDQPVGSAGGLYQCRLYRFN